MIKDNLSAENFAAILQSIAFVLFFAFFIAVAVWTFRSNKEFAHEMNNKPLNEDELFHSKSSK